MTGAIPFIYGVLDLLSSCFSLSLSTSIQPGLCTPFTMRPEYAARARSRKAFGLIEGELMDVRVQFFREAADYFNERQWHPTQRVNTLENGDVIVNDI